MTRGFVTYRVGDHVSYAGPFKAKLHIVTLGSDVPARVYSGIVVVIIMGLGWFFASAVAAGFTDGLGWHFAHEFVGIAVMPVTGWTRYV